MAVTVGLVAFEVLALHRHRENVPDSVRPYAGRKAGLLMSTHITVDPVTRIEGHLRIDVEVDGGVVTKAWSSGQMFRGIERILQGRDPRDAWLFTQRFCGVCTTVHAIASVRAVENALRPRDPEERAVHPQPDRDRARAARSHRPLLSAVRARLGRRRLGAQGRSGEDRAARRRASRTGPATARSSSRP